MLLVAHIIEKEREKAFADGRELGRKEAYKDAAEQIDAYFKRMDAARAAGEPFNEPPPRFRRNGR